MALAPGARVGPYEILGALGAGGMGEVYRARDTRLGREVALKVLPPEVATDAVRRARFEQEARAAAALNHPNILGVHDTGSDGDVFYIATELVNGETLAAILEGGPIPARRLLDIAVQIADGMACAHAAQIIHRDLKPGNVMVAPDGRVKILDFGLAKQLTRTVGSGDATIAVHHTEAGMIVGTVSYMSPEQARGKPTDHRSDQFSFGLLLYEMATGTKAFDRPESVQTMSAIISEEPPPITARIPAPLRWALDRCLAKDPAGRYESTRDLFHELRSLRDHLSEASTEVAVAALPAPAARRRPGWSVPAAFALGALAALAAILVRSSQQLPDQSAYRYTPFSFEPGGQQSPVWSPDGKAVAYAARQEAAAHYQVFIRYLNAATPLQLTRATAGAYPIAWSPDGTRILFVTDRRPFALSSIATVGGEPEPLMTLPPIGNQLSSDRIAISPDNKAVAVFRSAENGVYSVWITSPLNSQPKQYAPDPFATKDLYNAPRLRFSPDGKRLLLFLNAGRRGEEAWLLDYPPGSGAGPRLAFPDLQTYGSTPAFAWMPDSRHVVLSLQPAPNAQSQLWLADTTSGTRHALTSGTTGSSGPAISPDGERLILTETTGHYDIVSVDLTTAAARKLIATERNELMPSWAAQQPALVYVSDRNGPNEIWLHRPDNPDRPIVTARDFDAGTTQWFMAPALSPDASRVIYVRTETGTTTARLWISGVAGGTPIRLTNDTASEFPGSWSPDGVWFVYPSLRDGKANLMKVKATGQTTPILLKGDIQDANVPAWSPAGNWIAYGEHLISPDGKTVKPLGEHRSPHYMFSADGQSVYGVRTDYDKERELLVRIDVATGAETIVGDVGRDFRPGSYLNPAIRFSLAPDGKSLIYGSGKYKSNLWMLEGFSSRPGVLARLGF